MKRALILPASLAVVLAYAVACATSSTSSTSSSISAATSAAMSMSPNPPSPDPRVGLRPGTLKQHPNDSNRRIVDQPAAEAIWNLRLLSNSPSSMPFRGQTNSDLAFTGKYAIQGNYDGYQVWDISNPRRPELKTAYLCPASQSDVSVYGKLLFVSAEGQSGRTDCGTQGIPQSDTVSTHRIRGIRVFDITDITKPRYVGNVQSCRGSHTHTVVSDLKDPKHVYVYISGSSGVRDQRELPGCIASPTDPNSALFRIEVIQVPLDAPDKARVVGGARIFADLQRAPSHGASAADSLFTPPPGAAGRGGRGGGGGGRGAGAPPAAAAAAGAGRAGAGGGAGGGGGGGGRGGPNQCHDITVYPAVGLAGGACGGNGLLLDISNVANPVRIDAVSDSNMSFWHSATFSNDGTKILFTDEWGGGRGARCRALDKPEWGANAYFTIENRKMVFKSYWKMPAAQTSWENCVAHNGSLLPIPGREVMVQGWYQGGISVFDWTDPMRVKEIAFHDRGPSMVPADTMLVRTAGPGGSWSVYWYNGHLISSEILRGLDIFELVPSAHLSRNEIDAANTVVLKELNAQEQPKYVWPPSFSLARAYVDQLERSSGLPAGRIAAVRTELAAAERASGGNRRNALTQLATQLDTDVSSSRDQAKARLLAGAVRDLANATR